MRFVLDHNYICDTVISATRTDQLTAAKSCRPYIPGSPTQRKPKLVRATSYQL